MDDRDARNLTVTGSIFSSFGNAEDLTVEVAPYPLPNNIQYVSDVTGRYSSKWPSSCPDLGTHNCYPPTYPPPSNIQLHTYNESMQMMRLNILWDTVTPYSSWNNTRDKITYYIQLVQREPNPKGITLRKNDYFKVIHSGNTSHIVVSVFPLNISVEYTYVRLLTHYPCSGLATLPLYRIGCGYSSTRYSIPPPSPLPTATAPQVPTMGSNITLPSHSPTAPVKPASLALIVPVVTAVTLLLLFILVCVIVMVLVVRYCHKKSGESEPQIDCSRETNGIELVSVSGSCGESLNSLFETTIDSTSESQARNFGSDFFSCLEFQSGTSDSLSEGNLSESQNGSMSGTTNNRLTSTCTSESEGENCTSESSTDNYFTASESYSESESRRDELDSTSEFQGNHSLIANRCVVMSEFQAKNSDCSSESDDSEPGCCVSESQSGSIDRLSERSADDLVQLSETQCRSVESSESQLSKLSIPTYRVFVFYSLESQNEERILYHVVQRLRLVRGIEVSYPRQRCRDSIPQWIEEAVQEAVAVFIVCDEAFSKDWESKTSPYVNALKLLIEAKVMASDVNKFAVVVFDNEDQYIPSDYLRSFTKFNVRESCDVHIAPMVHFAMETSPYELHHVPDSIQVHL